MKKLFEKVLVTANSRKLFLSFKVKWRGEEIVLLESVRILVLQND